MGGGTTRPPWSWSVSHTHSIRILRGRGGNVLVLCFKFFCEQLNFPIIFFPNRNFPTFFSIIFSLVIFVSHRFRPDCMLLFSARFLRHGTPLYGQRNIFGCLFRPSSVLNVCVQKPSMMSSHRCVNVCVRGCVSVCVCLCMFVTGKMCMCCVAITMCQDD